MIKMIDPLASKKPFFLSIGIVIAFIIGIAGIFFTDYSPSDFENKSSLIKSISANKNLDIIFLYIDDYNSFIIPDATE